ncbi:MAG: CDP-alcohol phosphatidyltransferase family protein [Chloroflexota bacterium]|nr:CDP-alcohol phosphatidyltransferase family protein [Chloroflexota bacterium]MDE3192520.1 CDP-alcohol phosphatidyltransferase family protein [Chloroflexota bacterium]
MATHGIVPDRAASATRGGLAPLARRLRAAGVTANAVTGLGVALSLVGAALVAADRPLAALVVLVVGSVADTLDGAIARVSGGGTRLGAFLDSTADRVADAALFGAAAWLGAWTGDGALLFAALVAMPLSFFVPYVRAKAESLGVAATVGPAPREARLVVLLAGIAVWALLGLPAAFTTAIVAVAILAAITFVQRVAAVWRALARG